MSANLNLLPQHFDHARKEIITEKQRARKTSSRFISKTNATSSTRTGFRVLDVAFVSSNYEVGVGAESVGEDIGEETGDGFGVGLFGFATLGFATLGATSNSA